MDHPGENLQGWQDGRLGFRHHWAFFPQEGKIMAAFSGFINVIWGLFFSRMWTCAKISIGNAPMAPTDATVPAPVYKPISAQSGPSVPVSGVLTSISSQSCPGTELANVLAWPHISYHHEPTRQSDINPASQPP